MTNTTTSVKTSTSDKVGGITRAKSVPAVAVPAVENAPAVEEKPVSAYATALRAALATTVANSNRADGESAKMTVIAGFKISKNGTLEARAMPDSKRVAWTLSVEQYEKYCDCIRKVYQDACGCNKYPDEQQYKNCVDALSRSLTEYVKLFDSELTLGNTGVTRNMFENVRSYAQKVLVFTDGRAYRTNVPANTFVRFLEREMGVVIDHTTFADDKERDFQRHMGSWPRAERALKDAIAKAEQKLDDAIAAQEMFSGLMSKIGKSKQTKEMQAQADEYARAVTNAESWVDKRKAALVEAQAAHAKIIQEHNNWLNPKPAEPAPAVDGDETLRPQSAPAKDVSES